MPGHRGRRRPDPGSGLLGEMQRRTRENVPPWARPATGLALATIERLRQCGRCGEMVEQRNITFRSGGTDDISLCGACHGLIAQRWNDLTPKRAVRYQKVYGLTLEDHAVLFIRQLGRCAICQTEDAPLVVDHHHGDGHVRGLLCSRCNSAIGLLRDDPDVIAAASNYVRTT